MVDHRRELRICSHVACIVKDWESRLGHRLQSALAHFRSAPSLSVGRLTVVGRFCTRAPARLHLARRKHASIKLLFAKRQREVLDTRAMRVRSTIRGLYSFLTMYRDLSFFFPLHGGTNRYSTSYGTAGELWVTLDRGSSILKRWHVRETAEKGRGLL